VVVASHRADIHDDTTSTELLRCAVAVDRSMSRRATSTAARVRHAAARCPPRPDPPAGRDGRTDGACMAGVVDRQPGGGQALCHQPRRRPDRISDDDLCGTRLTSCLSSTGLTKDRGIIKEFRRKNKDRHQCFEAILTRWATFLPLIAWVYLHSFSCNSYDRPMLSAAKM